MEPEIFQDDEGNWWITNPDDLDPNGDPVIVPYEEAE